MKRISIVLASLWLAACAAPQNLAVSHNTLQSMNGKSVALVQRESPSFVAMTSGKGMFAVAGVGAAVAEGNRMVSDNGITDPAMQISRDVAQHLATDFGVRIGGETGMAESDDIDSLVAMSVGHDYALDVVTSGWSYIYDGFKFGDYFVGYSTKLRLIDVGTGEVVSSGFCAYDAKKAGKAAVTHDELLADNAAYIKSELGYAAETCVAEFRNGLFSPATLASR